MWLSMIWLCGALVVGWEGHILACLILFDCYLAHRIFIEKRFLRRP